MTITSKARSRRNACWDASLFAKRKTPKWDRSREHRKTLSKTDWLKPDQRIDRRSEDESWQNSERRLEEVISASKRIVEIENIFDEDDYRPYTVDTWRRSTDFLRRLYLHMQVAGKLAIALPRIVPAPSGSIDILWESSDAMLLINFPSDNGEATYSGRNKAIESSGSLLTDDVSPEILIWLSK